MVKMGRIIKYNKVRLLLFFSFIFLTIIKIYPDILYISNCEYPSFQLYICNDSGEEIKRITKHEYEYAINNPDYNPINGNIIFNVSSGRYGECIMMMNIYEGVPEIIIQEKDGYCDYPRFSPNGEEVLFIKSSDNEYENFNLYIFDLKTKKIKRLTNLGSCTDPMWSNDGSKIVFMSYNNIYVINKDGSGLNKITDDDFWKYRPIFSNDDNIIYYIAEVVESTEFSIGKTKIFNVNIQSKKIKQFDNLKDNYWDIASYKENKMIFTTKGGGSKIVITDLLTGEEEIILHVDGLISSPIYIDKNIIDKLDNKLKG